MTFPNLRYCRVIVPCVCQGSKGCSSLGPKELFTTLVEPVLFLFYSDSTGHLGLPLLRCFWVSHYFSPILVAWTLPSVTVLTLLDSLRLITYINYQRGIPVVHKRYYRKIHTHNHPRPHHVPPTTRTLGYTRHENHVTLILRRMSLLPRYTDGT